MMNKFTDADALRHVLQLLNLSDLSQKSDTELILNLPAVLGTVAGEVANLQEIIRRQALANLTLVAEAAGAAKAPSAPAVQVPCPVCGGEAVGHLDALRRVYFIPASLVKPEPEQTTRLPQYSWSADGKHVTLTNPEDMPPL